MACLGVLARIISSRLTASSQAPAMVAAGSAPFSSLSPTKVVAAGIQQAAGAAAMPPVGFR